MTVVVAVALATIAIGITAAILGGLRLGRFIRFVPFPVIGGFLAGSGYLILMGGLGVVAGQSLSWTSLAALGDPAVLLRFAAALGFLVPLALLQLRLPTSLALPAVALAVIVVFNLVVLAAGLDDDALRAGNWLISLPEGTALWPPIHPADIGLVRWSEIAAQLVNLPTVVILTVIAVLMNATGIELDTRRDVDLDRELRSVGLQNLLGGIGGGMPGFPSISLTMLANRLRAPNVIVGLIASAFCVAALLFGNIVLSIVPTPLLGGLLIWIGLSLLIEWLVRAQSRLTRWEYLVVLLIFLVIVLVSFAAGILVGLIAAAILFVVEYGQVEIVRHVMTGRDYQSSNDTSENRREVLRSEGAAILIVRLQGFLFFGTADRLRKRIQQRIEHHEGLPIRYLVVDFQRVSGLDSSTALSFTRLAQMTGPDGFVLVLCGMSDAVRSAITRGGLENGDGARIHVESDLDHGLEWSENQLLSEVAPQIVGGASVPVIDLLFEIVKDRPLAEALLPFLERIDIEPGTKLIEQGTPSDDIYFVERGRAAVELESRDHAPVRVATIGRGSIVGEMAFYLRKPRTASVVAEAPLVAWRFSGENLERLRHSSPEAVIAFHRGMAGMLADRLISTNQLVRLLAD